MPRTVKMTIVAVEENCSVVNWDIDDTAVPAHHNDKDKIYEITAAAALALKGTGGNGKISSNKWINRSGNDENTSESDKKSWKDWIW